MPLRRSESSGNTSRRASGVSAKTALPAIDAGVLRVGQRGDFRDLCLLPSVIVPFRSAGLPAGVHHEVDAARRSGDHLAPFGEEIDLQRLRDQRNRPQDHFRITAVLNG